jgi:endonuclease YncB( thermonuclease family)
MGCKTSRPVASQPDASQPVVSQPVAFTVSDYVAADSYLPAEKQAEDFSWKGCVCLARVVEVHDGDTVRILFVNRSHDKFVQIKLRLARIDAPELHPRLGTPNRENIIRSAQASRDALAKLILGKVVQAELGNYDKYGRVLAELKLHTVGINDWMVEKHYAVLYDGGEK